MSVQAINSAYAIKAGSPSNKAVLLSLANHANEQMQCWPSIATIANETELSDDTVSRCLASLATRGLITRTPRYASGTRARTSDLYTLTFPHDAAMSPHHTATSPRDAATPPRTVQGRSPQQGGDIEPSKNPQEEPTVNVAPAATHTRKRVSRGKRTPLPDGWNLTGKDRQHGHDLGLNDAQIDWIAEEFAEYWRTDGGAKANWSLTFRNWLNRQIGYMGGAQKVPRKQSSSSPAATPRPFNITPASPSWNAWRSYYSDAGKSQMLREMTRCTDEGAPFPVTTEWPPGYEQMAA